MLKKYKLGDKIIEATEDRYNRDFKDIGYVPYVERKQEDKTDVENDAEDKPVADRRRNKDK